MYCSGCGTSIQPNLIYCSRCGRRVAEDSAANFSPAVLAAYTAGAGFMAFIFVILVLAKTGSESDVILKVSVLYLSALFGISFPILRQGATAARTLRHDETKPLANIPADGQFKSAVTSQLEEGRDHGIGSVTEVTTRTLDEVLIERK